MKFIYLLLFALVFNSKNIYASENKLGDSILWRLTKGHEVINILGVIHVGFENQYPINKAIENTLNSSGALFFESSVLVESNQQTKERLLKVYRAESKDATLEALLNSSHCEEKANKKELVEKISKLAGSDLLKGLLMLSPRALVHQLYSHQRPLTEIEVKDLKLAESLERHFVKRAIQSNKKILSLDPEYWESIDALNDIEKCDLLVGMVDVYSSDKYKKRTLYEFLSKIKLLWLEGNSIEMRRQEFLWFEENTPSFSKSLTNWFALRNQYMADKISHASTLEQSELLVVIGAAHLAGSDGVITKLERLGYIPRPVMLEVTE